MKDDKRQAIELIEQMPDGVSAETIIQELQFRVTVLRRGRDAERGESVISHDEATRRLGKWLNSAGT